MAHIPYGYRIERGRASPEPGQAEKLNAFIGAYLKGLSVKEAKKASGIELSVRSIMDYLRAGTYAGTEYYPAIVPEGTKERILEELERRTHPGFAILPDDITVQNMFQTEEPEGQCSGSAAEVAGAVYNLIVPAKNGRTFMNSKEKAVVNAWAGKMEERVWQ